jgi:hypothetical protein
MAGFVKYVWKPVSEGSHWTVGTFTNDQIAACVQFSQLLNHHAATGLISRLELADARHISLSEMIGLVVCLQRIILPGATMHIEFEWTTPSNLFGQCSVAPNTHTVPPSVVIALNCNRTKTNLPACSRLDPLAQSRLSVLLHWYMFTSVYMLVSNANHP